MSTEEKRSMGGENSKDEGQKIDNNNGDLEKNSDFEFSDGNTDDGYSDDDDDDDYISDDEPHPKPEPRVWVVRKYHKDDKDDYFDDFRLDCDHEFVVKFSPGRPNIPKGDDRDGSYMSDLEDRDDFVLPPYMYNQQFQLASASSIDDATTIS